jgi:hypothetical protein
MLYGLDKFDKIVVSGPFRSDTTIVSILENGKVS